MNEHPLILAYRSLFTLFLTMIGFNVVHLSLPSVIGLFVCDTVVHFHPRLFRADLLLHHASVIAIFSTAYVGIGNGSPVLYALQSELYSVCNFLRHTAPRFYHCWRVGTLLFWRLPLWVWLFHHPGFDAFGHLPLKRTGFAFWVAYDMYLLRALLKKNRDIIYAGEPRKADH